MFRDTVLKVLKTILLVPLALVGAICLIPFVALGIVICLPIEAGCYIWGKKQW